jgi:hypothetical protein
MLQVGSFPATLHGTVTRRAFLAAAGSAPFGLAAAGAPPGGRAKS